MSLTPQKKQTLILMFLTAFFTVSVAFGVGMLVNIFEKKQQAKVTFYQVAELTNETEDPAIWGRNFPLHYADYIKTVDQVRTRYGGSESIPRTPSQSDPRSVVAQSKLEEDPRLKTMWAGYAFSVDFREERGHSFMLIDQIYTDRQNYVQQPGTCINCHASTVVAMNRWGGGDITKGFEAINRMKYSEAKTVVQHPVSCIDCHNPKTMELRVTRPAFMEGIASYKKSQGAWSYDVNKDATRQEMRSFVCGQCHVEYYFKGEGKRLVFPWKMGLKADEILAYYEEEKHKDWKHKLTDAPVLKAQHPEFEMWSQGIHAKSGVSCVDCHMPYKRVGAMKITDHHVRSPLLNINRACQTCHHFSEDELRDRVETIQNRHYQLRNVAMDALIDLIHDIEKDKSDIKGTKKLESAQSFQRKAQFLLDFAEAENSTGFHAPQESSRILGLSIDYSRQGQKALRD